MRKYYKNRPKIDQIRCHFHALIRRNAIKRVFIAATSPAQHSLGPPTQLHAAVSAD